MTLTRDRMEGLVMLMQGAFLDDPALTLTLQDAERRFEVDGATSQAVLGALIDASVLEKTAHGGYVRFFPTRSELLVAGTAA